MPARKTSATRAICQGLGADGALAQSPDPLPERAERQVVADELLSEMASIRRTIRRYAGRPLELSALTGSQLELVRLMRRRPGVSVAEAASDLRLAPNTVSTLVRQLTEAGLVSRSVDSSDRRVARLELAPAIRRKVDAWRDRRVIALSSAIGRLSREDERCLSDAVRVLRRVAEQLEVQAGTQGEGR
jgi:DNA-binding MarR family transcriptional regulator